MQRKSILDFQEVLCPHQVWPKTKQEWVLLPALNMSHKNGPSFGPRVDFGEKIIQLWDTPIGSYINGHIRVSFKLSQHQSQR